MAYQTGNAANVDDVLNAFATFLANNGWTQLSLVDDGHSYEYDAHGVTRWDDFNPTQGRRLAVTKGGMYFILRSFRKHCLYDLETIDLDYLPNYGTYSGAYMSGIAVTAASGYQGGNHWNQQPNAPILQYDYQGQTYGDPVGGVGAACLTYQHADNYTNIEYHFYATGDGVILEMYDNYTDLTGGSDGLSNKTRFLTFGRLDDLGDGWVTGSGLLGMYFFGSNPSTIFSGFSGTTIPWYYNDARINNMPFGCGAFYLPAFTDERGQSYGAQWHLTECDLLRGRVDVSLPPTSVLPGYSYDSDAFRDMMAPFVFLSDVIGDTQLPLAPLMANLKSMLPFSASDGYVRDSFAFRLVGSIPNIAVCGLASRSHGDTVQHDGDTWNIRDVNKSNQTGALAFKRGTTDNSPSQLPVVSENGGVTTVTPPVPFFVDVNENGVYVFDLEETVERHPFEHPVFHNNRD